ncbi:sensor histidine kinase [Roseibacillus persicicus]|uniref:sensor histidine kinase n=1 Tax=Roseibacillus persicicus TaxID=454148 RepID=UPI00280EFEE3|nr:HAMP domain-containing sensor histidine kinase [Roseibacillus persicicus]MDQ8192090.1 HAMP domain-containing sensor histidine kinase [Roseibacillus persicicus]
MKRSFLIWGSLLLCGALILGAFGFLSRALLDSEQQRLVDQSRADLEERSRLALSQMDGVATGLLIAESQRAAEEFQVTMPDGQLSPLVAGSGDFVRLNFEIDSEGQIRSPQIPNAQEKLRALASGVEGDVLQKFEQEFVELKRVLNQSYEGKKGFQIACANVNELVDWGQAFEVQKPDWSTPSQLKQEAGYQTQFNNATRSKRGAVLKDTLEKVVDNRSPLNELTVRNSLGAYEPLWLGEELFLIRESNRAGVLYRQGIWLQTAKLRESLLDGVKEWLPEAGLEKISNVEATQPLALVALPWQLVRQEPVVAQAAGWTPLRVSLLMGWLALGLALLAAGSLVRGVVRLSERRADFVSSVTHELRTPLTTFRLYSGMLVDGMVPGKEQQDNYLRTMSTEAERLHHLVENVLAYSRLEKGGQGVRKEKTTLGALLLRCEDRLRERVAQEEADFVLVNEEPEFEIETDISGVEQILFNLVDNACKYGLPESGRGEVRIEAQVKKGEAFVRVCDQGSGIRFSERRRLFRPFHKSALAAASSKPGVGLGLSLCRRLARMLGGDLTIEKVQQGACFQLKLR